MIRVYNDAPSNWQLGFQEEATPVQAGIIDFHNKAMYYLIFIFVIVTYFIIVRVYSDRSINWLRGFTHSSIIEFIWTIIPGIILVVIGIPSLKLLYALDDIAHPLVTLKATGAQWYWTYGIHDIDGLDVNFDSYTLNDEDLSSDTGLLRLLDVDNPIYLPILTPVRLLISGQDVIHSFFIPSLGIKLDAIPGRINHTSLYLLRPGVYYGQCTELCGQSHHKMSIVLHAVDTPSYLSWLSSFA
jgi:cytochrome c oxidase subunit 2